MNQLPSTIDDFRKQPLLITEIKIKCDDAELSLQCGLCYEAIESLTQFEPLAYEFGQICAASRRRRPGQDDEDLFEANPSGSLLDAYRERMRSGVAQLHKEVLNLIRQETYEVLDKAYKEREKKRNRTKTNNRRAKR